MWDLTPDVELLRELPQEYAFETALADIIVSIYTLEGDMVFFNVKSANKFLLQDNSLQAIWSKKNKDRMIR